MITILLARYGFHAAIAAGLLTIVLAWDHSRINQAKTVAVHAEQSRVETEGKKTDAVVIKKQRAAASQPPDSVLGRWQTP